ncbi:MAG TPA: ABC transporter ATP-binding protein, partial [Desulfobulbaceae bacterium]|nr:ABC transporter ATP-binding protein [Desulfobulbaceae bacterium]
MHPLLTLDKLCLSFLSDQEPSGEKKVLRRVSFRMYPGRTHALVGESGSGKSVTAMTILRLLEETSRITTSGRIVFDGRDILQLSMPEIRHIRGNDIAMVFQEPMTSLNPVYTIGNQLLEPLLLHRNMPREEAWDQGLQLLSRCGIREPEYRMNAYPHQLSGGQRQRIMIAMALACRPKLLIADEPTTALDVTIQRQILDLLMDIQKEYQMTILLITHDLPMVRRIAESVSIMYQGRIVEQGAVAKIFKSPEDPYTRHLLTSLPDTTNTPRTGGPTLLDLQDIHCRFTLSRGGGLFSRGRKNILKAVDGVSLKIAQGTTLGVVGESGSGKSTLALCVLRLISCRGRILYHRGDANIDLGALTGSGMRPLRKELQIVFQDPFSSLSPRLSVEQIIGEGLKVHKIGTKKERKKLIARVLEEVELDPDMAARFPHEFSGGQRQRIAIARALVLRPRLLILDEPTSALDMTIQAQVIDLLRRLQTRHNMTYIFITHDLRVIRSLADTIAVMRQGRIVEYGPCDRLFSAPENPYTKALF